MDEPKTIAGKLRLQATKESNGDPVRFLVRWAELIGEHSVEQTPAWSDDAEARWIKDNSLEPDALRVRFADGSSTVMW